MCPASALHILKAVSSSWHDSVRRVLHSTVWKTRCAHEALEDLRAKPVSVDIDDGMTIKLMTSLLSFMPFLPQIPDPLLLSSLFFWKRILIFGMLVELQWNLAVPIAVTS